VPIPMVYFYGLMDRLYRDMLDSGHRVSQIMLLAVAPWYESIIRYLSKLVGIGAYYSRFDGIPLVITNVQFVVTICLSDASLRTW
jgi:hypothetical protein